MRAKLEVLAADVGPLKSALEKVNEELKQIERSRINGVLDREELDRFESDAVARKADLEARLAEISPDRLDEVEALTRMLNGYERVLEIAASRKHQKRSMNEFDLLPESFENDDSELFEGSAHWPLSPREGENIGAGLGRLLDRIHAQVVVYDGRAEVNGLVELGVPISMEKSLQVSRSSTR